VQLREFDAAFDGALRLLRAVSRDQDVPEHLSSSCGAGAVAWPLGSLSGKACRSGLCLSSPNAGRDREPLLPRRCRHAGRKVPRAGS
jgi:hypothetical protein